MNLTFHRVDTLPQDLTEGGVYFEKNSGTINIKTDSSVETYGKSSWKDFEEFIDPRPHFIVYTNNGEDIQFGICTYSHVVETHVAFNASNGIPVYRISRKLHKFSMF